MPKQLTTQNASITTVAVEVKALTIGSKQVTLSVFRQLQEEPLIAHDGTLNGVPWGHVNYHPDKCGDDPEHLHIVWQKDDRLRRASVQAPYAGHHLHPAADLYVQARIWNGTARSPLVPVDGDNLAMGERIGFSRYRYFLRGRFTHDGMGFEGASPAPLREAWRANESPSVEDWDAFVAATSFLGVSGNDSLDQVEKQLLSRLPVDAYPSAWAEARRLPQLFIAV